MYSLAVAHKGPRTRLGFRIARSDPDSIVCSLHPASDELCIKVRAYNACVERRKVHKAGATSSQDINIAIHKVTLMLGLFLEHGCQSTYIGKKVPASK